ncbi:DUF2285 domain-containing protein [Caulobacter segnis]
MAFISARRRGFNCSTGVRRSPRGPLLVVLAFDQDFGLRVRAVERLNRAVAGLAAPASQVTAAQRERLAKSLVALDGDLAGDSYRAIAAAVFGPDPIERELWRTSSVRAATIRLVQAGRRMMRRVPEATARRPLRGDENGAPVFVIRPGRSAAPAYPNDAGLMPASPRIRHEQRRPFSTPAAPQNYRSRAVSRAFRQDVGEAPIVRHRPSLSEDRRPGRL